MGEDCGDQVYVVGEQFAAESSGLRACEHWLNIGIQKWFQSRRDDRLFGREDPWSARFEGRSMLLVFRFFPTVWTFFSGFAENRGKRSRENQG